MKLTYRSTLLTRADNGTGSQEGTGKGPRLKSAVAREPHSFQSAHNALKGWEYPVWARPWTPWLKSLGILLPDNEG